MEGAGVGGEDVKDTGGEASLVNCDGDSLSADAMVAASSVDALSDTTSPLETGSAPFSVVLVVEARSTSAWPFSSFLSGREEDEEEEEDASDLTTVREDRIKRRTTTTASMPW